MSNQSLSIEDTITRNYQLDVNDLYEYPSQDVVKALKTCPLLSEIKVTESAYSTGNQFTFDAHVGKTQFISNVFKFHYDVPLVVKLKTAAAVNITKDNFIDLVFNNNSDICLSQQGISQSLIYSDVVLNGTTFQTVNDIPELTNITSPYYDTKDVNEYLQASQPDRFQSFENYNGSGNQVLKFIGNDKQETYTTVSPENEQNIFGSKYQSGYSARTPQWVFVDAAADKLSCQVRCRFWSYFQFSIGAVPSEESALTGIDRLGFTTRLHPMAPAFLFNIKKTVITAATVGPPATDAVWGYRYSDITLDTTQNTQATCKLYTKHITPPQFMIDQSVDRQTGLMKPYTIGCPRIMCHKFNTSPTALNFGDSAEFNQASTLLNAIPRSIYVTMVKLRKGTFEQIASTPVNFGLITNLTVQIDSAMTTFSDINALDLLTNSNGYDELDPLGKLLKGYPIKLNMGKDVTLPQDTVIGAAGRFNLSVHGNFVNQGVDPAMYQLVVTVVYDDTIVFDGSNFNRSSGILVPQQLFNERYFLQKVYANYQKDLTVIGGSSGGRGRYGGGKFADAMKWVGRNVVKLAKNAWDNRDKIASTVGDVAGLLKAVKGGRLAASNTSGGSNTLTLGAGSVKSSVFK